MSVPRTAGANVAKGQHSFAQIPRVEIPRSVFNRSHRVLTTFDSGFLIPVYVDEALPGDTFAMNARFFGRMATPIYPVMDNFYLESFFFAVPVRLLWDNWEKFNGAQDNPGDSTDFLVPQITETVAELSVSDYMGIPIKQTLTFNALHHRAYNLIWNEWFRSQDLQQSQPVNTNDGPDDPTNYKLLRRGKRHDYFTSCLPFTQKGLAVELPLGQTAPITGQITGSGAPVFDVNGFTTQLAVENNVARQNTEWSPVANQQGVIPIWDDPALDASGLSADLSSATAATINDIRLAFQTQRMLEKDARGGTRYTEIVRGHFGVTSPDERLQRPEYLGGTSSRINVTPVPQTNTWAAPGVDPQTVTGRLAGFTTMGHATGFVKSFTEHCVLVGMVNIRADITYQQGLDRMFSRRTRFDFAWPSLSHIGEQAVLQKEIYATGGANDDDVFGYQERYAEYRYRPSKVTGRMRSDSDVPLDSWHLALDFDQAPLLNDVFIEDDPPFDRVIQVQSEPQFWMDAAFDLRCARPLPTYGVPGLIDHF